jgi:dihydropteroate synthase
MTQKSIDTRAELVASRITSWRLRTRSLIFDRVPKLMGIVNCTPDSFSDGGKFFSSQSAVDHARRLLDEGADIIDIGGESTRPYSMAVDADEELRRVMPVVEAIFLSLTGDGEKKPVVSVDTSKARVAREAIAAGCEIINDVTALAGDSEMLAVARELECGVCVMHMQGTPQTMQDNPSYGDVVIEILDYLVQRRDALVDAGIDRERICLDPGVGFGKTHQHNLTLAANCWRFHELGCPVLVGHSRKGFIGKILGGDVEDRVFGTLGVSLSLARQCIQILRVHDVAATRQALSLFAATGGIDGQESRL